MTHNTYKYNCLFCRRQLFEYREKRQQRSEFDCKDCKIVFFLKYNELEIIYIYKPVGKHKDISRIYFHYSEPRHINIVYDCTYGIEYDTYKSDTLPFFDPVPIGLVDSMKKINLYRAFM